MIVLGVESTAHTFGVGIISHTKKVLANVKDSYTSPSHGMIPEEIVQHHLRVAEDVLARALKQASVTWDDVEFIAYSAGPGIDPVLWAGHRIVTEWAKRYGKKLVGVNHCCAHLSVGMMVNSLRDPCYLYVSGVNTQVIVQEKKKYVVLGETLDIGLGNMLDKFGRIVGLGFPAGPRIEQLALKGKYVELSYVVKGMDVSFSGILTRIEQLYKSEKANVEDLCFSVQETCFAMVAEVVERAMAHTGKKELLLIGGVAANKRFAAMLEQMCHDRGARFHVVPMDLAGDQGAMIAWEGYLRRKTYGDVEVNPQWRADEV